MNRKIRSPASGYYYYYYTHTAVLRAIVWDYPGGPVPEEIFIHSRLKRVVGICHHSGFLRRGKDSKGKCANNPAGRHPIRTNDAPTSIIPPILCWMLFLLQPSQFILAWDRQICWIAYLEAWFCMLLVIAACS